MSSYKTVNIESLDQLGAMPERAYKIIDADGVFDEIWWLGSTAAKKFKLHNQAVEPMGLNVGCCPNFGGWASKTLSCLPP